MTPLDVQRAIAKLDDDVIVESIDAAAVVNSVGIGAVFRVCGQRRQIEANALRAWMIEDLSGGATISQRLRATVRGGFG